ITVEIEKSCGGMVSIGLKTKRGRSLLRDFQGYPAELSEDPRGGAEYLRWTRSKVSYQRVFGDTCECCPLARRQIVLIRKDTVMRHLYNSVYAFGLIVFLCLANSASAQTQAPQKTPAKTPAQTSAKTEAKPAPLVVPQLKFEKYKLDNGLEVILSEDHRLPMV